MGVASVASAQAYSAAPPGRERSYTIMIDPSRLQASDMANPGLTANDLR